MDDLEHRFSRTGAPVKLRLALAAMAGSLATCAVLLLLGANDAKPPPVDKMPEIVVDRAPLDRAGRSPITSYADALEQVRGSVVSVASTKIVKPRAQGFPFDDPFFRRFFGPDGGQDEERVQRGLGSGVIVSANGYVLTNNHVVEGSDEIRVDFADGREVKARVVGADPLTDVAVVKIEGENFSHATLADSDLLRVGDIVFAVGNPLGVGQTTTMGIVSATGRSNLRLIDRGYENFIQTDASINPGNSGGALVDAQGRVVGINTAILSTSRGNIGIGFAIPINLAAGVMRSLVETGSVARGFLGVKFDAADETPVSADDGAVVEPRGVVISEVLAGSPAAKAGLQDGDTVLEIEGHAVHSATELRLAIAQMAPGSTAKIRYTRAGEARSIDVVLGRLDENTDFSGLAGDQLIEGIRVSAISPELRQQYELPDEVRGLVVIDATENSRYAALLPTGTAIVEINRQPATDVATARAAFGHGRNILFVNIRGAYRYVVISVN